jgi:hypothetical protein
VPAKFQSEASARLVDAMLSVGQDVVAKAAQSPSFIPTAQRMVELWSHGCTSHHTDAAQQLKAMATSLGKSALVLR